MDNGLPGNSGFGMGGGWGPRPWRPTTAAGALVSVVLFVVALVIMIALFHHSQAGSGGSGDSGGACIGGPATGAAGTPVGHGNYRFPCAGGGSTIVHIGN
jgi:hypothetical protein